MSVIDHQSDYVDDVLTRPDTVVSDLAELSLTSLPVEQLVRGCRRQDGTYPDLLAQQRGQFNLGTQTPFRWLHADHIRPHSKGGPTNLANGQMINGAENLAKRDRWNDED